MDGRYKHLQRKMRKNMPLPEVVLWQRIRKNQLGVKFRRQYTVGNRILDFYSPSIKLGIEIDGETHFVNEAQRNQELERDKALLAEHGVKMLRFFNPDVVGNTNGVVMKIKREISLSLKQRKVNPPS